MTSSVVIVTGASRGIGLAVCKALLAKDHTNVVGVARSAPSKLPEISELAAAHPGRFIYLEGDVSKTATSEAAVSAAVRAWGRVDALVLNAGVLQPIARLADVDIESFRAAIDINVVALVSLAKAAISYLRESRGRMIFVSSGGATNPYQGWGAYCASKAAMNSLNTVYAVEEPLVTSLAIRPGVVDTDMQALIREGDHAEAMTVESHEWFKSTHAAGKLIPVETPGHIITELSLNCPHSLTGKFFSWDSPELAEFRP